MRRFFAPTIEKHGDIVVLRGDEARHIRVVLRMKLGDEVLLIDGEGREYVAEISETEGEEVSLVIKSEHVSDTEPKVNVTLFQCLPKQGKMELIIQKCVELGVHEIVPVLSKRCVVKPEGIDNKLTRWNKISAEAAKQCGRAFVPAVTEPIKLGVIDQSRFDAVLAAYENEDGCTLRSFLREAPELKNIAIIIGPEGGFEPSEIGSLCAGGGVSVSLGRRILRTETAGMAMLAQIMYELDQ